VTVYKMEGVGETKNEWLQCAKQREWLCSTELKKESQSYVGDSMAVSHDCHEEGRFLSSWGASSTNLSSWRGRLFRHLDRT
jgi:hypothetical protein